MQRWKTFAALGGIWGVGIGIFFGPFPAGALVWGVLERFVQPDDERLLFAGFWGACVLLSGILGIVTGTLFGRLERTTIRRDEITSRRRLQRRVRRTQSGLATVPHAPGSPC